ncbi:MAG TPA: hypothetical protein VJ914_14305 [Pseudonocardiaceae bacterium]|nr:hypothetical protein [Pseudonocardiaceae bacterium]
MTDMQQRGGTPGEPPLSLDVLADLHAGAVPDDVATRLWPRVRADPAASATLTALDATRADLAGLATAPPPAMPADFAARLDAAINAEAQARATAGIAPVVDINAPRRRKRDPKQTRRLALTAGLVGVAAAVIGAAIVVLPGLGSSPSTSQNAGGSPSSQLSVSSGQLGSVALTQALHKTEYGPLSNPQQLSGCLKANGQDPNEKPIGAMQISLDGKQGTLLVLTTGVLAQYRLLVVGPACSATSAATLANQVIGGVPTAGATPTH